MALFEIFGWLGASLLGIRAIPQVLKCHKQGHSNGISRQFLWLWICGQIFMLSHFLLSPVVSISMVSYSVFVLCLVSVILYYKYFPRKQEAKIEIISEDNERSK